MLPSHVIIHRVPLREPGRHRLWTSARTIATAIDQQGNWEGALHVELQLALRNLANAARMVSDNPALMQLRLLQVVGEQSGNTVVLGMPSGATTVSIGGARQRIEGAPPDAPES